MSIIKIYKKPAVENSNYLFSLEDFCISHEILNKIVNDDEYIQLKYDKFRKEDLSTLDFEKFDYKRSLKDIAKKEFLYGTIYTHRCGFSNNVNYYGCINNVKKILKSNQDTSRNILRFGNSYKEYFESLTDKSIDVSCLYSIQYLPNTVNIVFRASDLKEELWADIITIYEFFILPIYGDNKIHEINFHITTSQNILYKSFFINKLREYGLINKVIESHV